MASPLEGLDGLDGEGLASLERFPGKDGAQGKRKLRVAVTPTFSRSVLMSPAARLGVKRIRIAVCNSTSAPPMTSIPQPRAPSAAA